MRHRTALGSILLLTATFAGAPPAEAGLKFCNQANFRFTVAVGYVDRQKGWVAKGWKSIEPGECKESLGFPLDNRFYYFYASGHGEYSNVKYTGETAFCIESRKFTIYQAEYGKSSPDECVKAGLRSANFLKIDVGTKPEYTVNLGSQEGSNPAASTTPARGAQPAAGEGEREAVQPPPAATTRAPAENAPPPSAAVEEPSGDPPPTPRRMRSNEQQQPASAEQPRGGYGDPPPSGRRPRGYEQQSPATSEQGGYGDPPARRPRGYEQSPTQGGYGDPSPRRPRGYEQQSPAAEQPPGGYGDPYGRRPRTYQQPPTAAAEQPDPPPRRPRSYEQQQAPSTAQPAQPTAPSGSGPNGTACQRYPNLC